jgi:hypothetical protein
MAEIEGLACGGPQGAFPLARSAQREEIKKRRPLDNGTIFEWGYLWVMFMAKFTHQILGNGKNYAELRTTSIGVENTHLGSAQVG